MVYQFNHALRINRTTFQLGAHEVPGAIEKHPHFQRFLKAGHIAPPGAAVKKSPPTLKPASSDLAKQATANAKASQIVKPDPVAEAPVFPADAKGAKKGK